MDKEKVWKRALGELKDNVTPIAYETWIKPLGIRSIDEELNIVYIEFDEHEKNDMILRTIKNRYLPMIEDAIEGALGEHFRVVVKDVDTYRAEDIKRDQPKGKKTKRVKGLDMEKIFNPKFTFENFVVGGSNDLAYAASLAVSESPSEAYNPFFIYGGSGLGKTHLLNAIGIHALELNPDLNVLYVTSEMFTNEYIEAIKNKNMHDFNKKYRELDILLIDDIQFIEGKEKVQEEFFNTFNTLHNSNKQIIIASDRSPDKLINLQERLRTRFKWNLIVDIQPADYETRVAILNKKLSGLNFSVEENPEITEVINLIAEKVKDNVRELEGALTRVVSFSQLLHQELTVSFAKEKLKDIFTNIESTITPEKIKKEVCKYYNVKVSDIISQKKTNNIAFPRQVAMYLVREMTDFSFPNIGQLFGNRHYTTVMYAHEKIENEIKSDKNLKEVIKQIKENIMSF